MENPLVSQPLFYLGPVPITSSVLVTWGIMIVLGGFAVWMSGRLRQNPDSLQATVELLVDTIDGQIRDTMNGDPSPYRGLIGTIFVFVLVSNWSSLIPGIEPPTAHLETDAALALIVFVATVIYGIKAQGLGGYLASFANPSWVMIPLNIVEQITRTFSLLVRLFGNVMSGVFVIGIVLSLAGLFLPIPLMALDLLTGAVQAYIFAVLATVFIGSAIEGGHAPEPASKESSQ